LIQGAILCPLRRSAQPAKGATARRYRLSRHLSGGARRAQ